MGDGDLNLPSDVNVQYYIARDFYYSPYVNECFSDEYFSILHCNSSSLTANFDNLQTMLSVFWGRKFSTNKINDISASNKFEVKFLHDWT